MNHHEEARQSALERYQILDTPLEKQFDDLVKLASHICGTPIALISLVDRDRQWFKAKIGIDADQTPRDISACQYTILQPDVMVIPDTHKDPRFVTNPLVTGDPRMRFYAGAPLTTPSGQRIGTVCVLDTTPRELDAPQQEALRIIARQVVTLLELRLKELHSHDREKVLIGSEARSSRALSRLNLSLDSGAVVGTWVWNIPNDHFMADERFGMTFGLDNARLQQGMKIADIKQSIHPDDRARVEELINEVLKQGGSYNAEYRVQTRDKQWKWIEANGQVELDAYGNALRFPGILIDIDERKRIELALSETQDEYQKLMDTIDQAFCIIEVLFDDTDKPYDYIFRKVNSAFEQHTGITNAVGRRMRDIAPQHEQEWFDTYGQIVRMKKAGRFTQYSASLARWYDVFAYPLDERHTNQVGVLFSDITAERFIQSALSERDEMLKLAQAAGGIGIFTVDVKTNNVTVSRELCRIFGLPEMETMPVSMFEACVLPEDRAMKSNDKDRKAGKSPLMTEYRIRRQNDGEIRWVGRKADYVRDEQGNVTLMMGVASDITERKEAERQMLEARNAAEAANIAKTEFLANMSHEIRTPMNAIIGLSHILSTSQPLTEKQKEFISTLQMSADSLLDLINDLLDISKIEARTVELEHIPFSVTTLIQEVASMMNVRVRDKALTFTCEGECIKHRMFMGDPTRLRQIVVNLCGNAIKFTETGGIHIAVTCEPCEKEGYETICINVKDTGIGIAQDKLETIFHKFVQADSTINRKFGGTGLGLAITKTLTEIMGGKITVMSTVGEGSTFTVRIPLQIAHADDAMEEFASEPNLVRTSLIHTSKPHILLVEDFAPNVLVAQTILEDFGYVVDVADNGLEAFEKVRDNLYVAVLMDVQMHGLNGFEATQLIREREKKEKLAAIPVIGMTAHALMGDRERCIAAGMDDYIAKPFNPEMLRSILDKYCVREKAA